MQRPETLRAAIDALPGTAETSLREVTSLRDCDGAVALSAMLVREGAGAVRLLVERLPDALWASWSVVVARSWGGIEVAAAPLGQATSAVLVARAAGAAVSGS